MLNKELSLKILFSCILFLSLLLSHSNWFDTVAEDYTEQGIKRTLITYAVARSLNGVISVAQGTELAVSPAGVGLTFAPGQILDPVNDLIERFSWVVMVSGSSLGIQRLFLEITSSAIVVWTLSFLIVINLVFLWFNRVKNADNNFFPYLNKALIVLIFVRFSVPLIAVLNEAVYLGYLQPQYELAQQQLENASNEIKLINKSSRDEVKKNKGDGLFDKVEIWLDKTRQSLDVESQMNSLKQAAADVSQQVINMIVVFVVQTLIFPLIFLWILVKSAKGIMSRVTIG
jgi:hypothetical protein